VGPTLRVPDDVAQRLEQDSDLVEAIVLPDAVDAPDIELGPPGGVMLELVEVPKAGFGELVGFFMASKYVNDHKDGDPFELIVRDKQVDPHTFPAGPVDQTSIRAHLQLAFFGQPGDRRPLL
jgi:hypothetical protein